MIGTESKLWDSLNVYSKDYPEAHLARVESPITPGCSDVEYTRLGPWNGWIELKTASRPRPGKAFTLHSPFTFAQAAWLLTHQNEKARQRSWMLIGVLGMHTWKGFVLVEPTPALKLLSVRKSEPHEEFLRRKGVEWLGTMKDVLKRIRSEK